MLALVLGGGNALGACHGGVVSALEATGILIACQTKWMLRAMRQAWRLHAGAPPAAVHRMTCASQPGETAMKGFDFPQSSLDRRWQHGKQDMRNALRIWRDIPPKWGTLAIHDGVAAPAMAAA